MTDTTQEFHEAVYAAVKNTIEEVGLDTVKKMSCFKEGRDLMTDTKDDDLVKRARWFLEGVTNGPWKSSLLDTDGSGLKIPQMPKRKAYFGESILAESEGNKAIFLSPFCHADNMFDVNFVVASRDLVPAMADRIEELEAKLAQQDDLMQAAVAAALREAAALFEQDALDMRAEENPLYWTAENDAKRILAIITSDAQAALDRVVAAERERCAKVADGEAAGPYFRLPAFHGPDACASIDGEVAQVARSIAAAIRKGDPP
jgi:hypothetical protein